MRHKNALVFCGMVAAFFAIIFFTMTSIKGKADVPSLPEQQEQQETDAGEDTKEETATAVIKKLDTKNMTLTATDVESGIEGVFSYTGGTGICSRRVLSRETSRMRCCWRVGNWRARLILNLSTSFGIPS